MDVKDPKYKDVIKNDLYDVFITVQGNLTDATEKI